MPAIATTNAIIAGFIVLEALKVLGGRVNELKYVSLRRNPDVRPKGQAWLQATSVDEPNPNCPVCGDSGITLTVDCATFTVGMLLDRVVKKHLSFNKPTIDYTTMADDGDQLCEGTDDVDDDDKAKFERYLTKPFGELPVPIGAGTTLEIEDVTQGLNVKMKVVHAVLDDEEVPLGFTLSGEHDPAAHAAAHAAADAAARRRRGRRRRRRRRAAAGERRRQARARGGRRRRRRGRRRRGGRGGGGAEAEEGRERRGGRRLEGERVRARLGAASGGERGERVGESARARTRAREKEKARRRSRISPSAKARTCSATR